MSLAARSRHVCYRYHRYRIRVTSSTLYRYCIKKNRGTRPRVALQSYLPDHSCFFAKMLSLACAALLLLSSRFFIIASKPPDPTSPAVPPGICGGGGFPPMLDAGTKLAGGCLYSPVYFVPAPPPPAPPPPYLLASCSYALSDDLLCPPCDPWPSCPECSEASRGWDEALARACGVQSQKWV